MFPFLGSWIQGGQDPWQKSSSNLHWGSQIRSEGDQVSPQFSPGGHVSPRVPQGPAHLAPPRLLPEVNVMLRKIAVAAASKPAVEIKQEGPSFYIKTSTTVRTTEVRFEVGEEFEEQTVDGRPCKVRDRWEEGRLVAGGRWCPWTRGGVLSAG